MNLSDGKAELDRLCCDEPNLSDGKAELDRLCCDEPNLSDGQAELDRLCCDEPNLSDGKADLGQVVSLLLLKKVGSARLWESGIHSISPKTPAPQYQPIDRKKRKGKKIEHYIRDRAA